MLAHAEKLSLCCLVGVALIGAAAPPIQPSGDTAIRSTLLRSWTHSNFDTLLISDSVMSPSAGSLAGLYNHKLVLRSVLDDYPCDSLVAEAWRAYEGERGGKYSDLAGLREALGWPVRDAQESPRSSANQEPWAFFRFSGIGYSHDSTFAFVFMDYYCGRLCGGADIYLLRGGPGGWSVVHNYPLYRS